MVQSSRRIRLSFVMLAVSAVFLFHPVVAFLDVLPDCIGLLLLCLAMEPFVPLNAHAEDAYLRFRRMLPVSVVSLFAEYYLYAVMPGLNTNRYERPVLLLVCTLVYAALQCYFLIPAFRELFLSLEELAGRSGREALFSARSRKAGRSLCARASAFSAWFVGAASLLSVLPEAAVLTTFEYETDSAVFRFDWYEFVSLFRASAALISLIFGIIWLILVLRIAARLLRDRSLTDAVGNRFSNFSGTHTERFRAARIRFSCVLIGLGFVFTANVRLDEHILLPGAVAAVLFCGGVLLSRKDMPAKKGFFLSAVFLVLMSIFSLFANASYLRRFIPEAAQYYEDAYYAFLVCQIAEIAEGIATAVCSYFLLRTLGDTVRLRMTVYGETDGKRTVLEHSTARLRKKFETLLFVITLLLPFIALGCIADALLRLRFEWIWWIPFLLSAAAFILLLVFLFGVSDWFREQGEASEIGADGE